MYIRESTRLIYECARNPQMVGADLSILRGSQRRAYVRGYKSYYLSDIKRTIGFCESSVHYHCVNLRGFKSKLFTS